MRVRVVRLDDAAAIAAIYAPVVIETAISFEAIPPDADEFRRRIELERGLRPWLVMADDADRAIGYVYGSTYKARHAYRFSSEVTVYIDAAARGRGVGRRLYTALLALLRAQGYRTAYAGITLPNAASVGLHVAMGFTPAGVMHAAGYKFGRWHDVAYYECALRERDQPTSDPQRFDDLDPDLIAQILTDS